MQLKIYRGVDWPSRYATVAHELKGVGFDQSWEWYSCYWEYVAKQDENVVLVTVELADGRIALALPMQLRQSKPRWLRGLAALSNYYTSLYRPMLLSSGISAQEVVSFFLSALQPAGLVWDELDLQPLAGSDEFATYLRAGAASGGYWSQWEPSFKNWYLQLSGGSYEVYEQALPAKLRNTLRRKRKRLLADPDVTTQLVVGGTDLERYIRDYEQVYKHSWKGQESHPEFIRAIIRTFADKGWLRMGMVYLADQPIATQLWFVKDGVASIYKLCYDEQFANYSAGTVLTAFMMQHVIDVDRVSLVDFLTGDDAYKGDWMSGSQHRYRLRVYNRHTIRGRSLAVWRKFRDFSNKTGS